MSVKINGVEPTKTLKYHELEFWKLYWQPGRDLVMKPKGLLSYPGAKLLLLLRSNPQLVGDGEHPTYGPFTEVTDGTTVTLS